MAGGIVDLYAGGKSPSGGKSGGGGGVVDLYGGGPAASKKSGGGGGIGGFFHTVGSKIGLAGHDIAQIPGGLYQVGKAASHDSAKLNDITEKHLGLHRSAYERHADATPFELPAVGKGFVKSTKETLEHPLRDPFATLLTVAPIVGTAGRVGEAGIAARAADIGAGESRLAEAGKALVRRQPTERVLHVGDKRVTMLGSRNAGVRLMQRGYDRMVQGALDREARGEIPGRVVGRVAKHGMKRAAGALGEEERIAQRIRAVPANLLDRAASKLSKTPGKAGSRAHQAALELTSVQTPAHEAAAYHYAQAAKGISPRQNARIAKLYEKVAQHDLVHVDESRPAGQKVYINPAEKKLAEADAKLAKVQERGDTTLAEHGVMEPGELEQRRNAPGRIRGGATYEKPTPGKLGIESPALKAARSKVARLEKAHASATAKALKNPRSAGFPGRLTYEERAPKTIANLSTEELHARVDELDARYNKVLDELAAGEGRPGDYKGVTAYQNAVSKKLGRRGLAYRPVSQQLRDLAESKLLKFLESRPDVPHVQRLVAELNESAALRKEIAARNDAALGIGGHEQQPIATTTHPVFKTGENSPTVARLSSALSVAKDELQRLEQQAGNRVKPTGIVGGETAREGRGFVSERISQKTLARSQAAASRSKTVGETKLPIDKKPYTGRALEHGLRPKNVTGAASHHLRQIQRFENTVAIRDRAVETGSDVRRSTRDILVRVRGESASDINAHLRQVLGQEKSTVDTPEELKRATDEPAVQAGLAAAHRMFTQHLLDRADESKSAGIGETAPNGYRWVDENLLKGLEEPSRAKGGAGAAVGRAVDSANSAVTAMTVYFKIGHIGTRVLTNAATNFMQGALKPLDVARSYKLWSSLSEEERARLLAASGQHGFAALPHDEGLGNVVARGISGGASKGAQFWARHADAPFRFNALAYELRKAGISTVEETKRALDALEHSGQGLPAHEWSKISAAARRADREAISYDRLNDFERRYLTRGIWFYPWIKGSSLFTVRSILEHPVKAAIGGQAGVHGREEQLRTLGDVPSYEQGLVALGGGDHPLTTDLSTFSPFATAGDVLKAPAEPGSLAGFFNPVLGATGQFAYGLNQYGAPSSKPYEDAALALAAPTPEQQIAEALAARGQDQSGRMFEKTPGSTLLRFLVGPSTPRRVNKSALAKAAARERSGQR